MKAEAIAKALNAHKFGSTWLACCPAHEDRQPSLSITRSYSGKVLVQCHAGCDQKRVVAKLRLLGLWHDYGAGPIPPPAQQPNGDGDGVARSETALRLWHASQAAGGTAVETYLATRGLRLRPPILRYHPRLRHPSGGVWPTMVALVTRRIDNTPLAIHRTFLHRNTAGKAPIAPVKMMLSPCGGGVVRLAEVCGVLMVGEGIETCLAAMQVTGIPTWAALSTSGLRALNLPADILDIIVLADGDEAGEAAAQNCANRWNREGRRVRIARPPRGSDFNDLIRITS